MAKVLCFAAALQLGQSIGLSSGGKLEERISYYDSAVCINIREMGIGLPPAKPTKALVGPPKDGASISPDECYEFCRKSQVMYMGLRGSDCSCFDVFKGDEEPENMCDRKCAGSAEDSCGGPEDLYSVHLLLAWIPKPPVYKCAPPVVEGAAEVCQTGSDKASERGCNVTCAPGRKLTENTLICDTVVGKWAGIAHCSEIKCGPPPDVPWASRSCLHASAVGEGKCNVECQGGSTLEENSLRCVALPEHPDTVGFYDGQAICAPKSCGVPPKHPNTMSLESEALFPLQVRYTCDHGFTLDAQATGITAFFTQCREDGKLTVVDEKIKCQPVECGEPAAIPHGFRIPDVSGEIKKFLVYPHRASYKCEKGYSIDGFGRLQQTEIVCEASGKLTKLLPCQPTVCGLAQSKPNAKLLADDKARMIPFPEIVKYRCDVGHELETGATEFHVECQDNGAFTAAPVCKPMSCGLPPVVANAQVAAQEMVFPHKTQYSCQPGHSTNSEGDGPDSFEVECQADKQFSPLKACEPVRCPRVPELAHAVLSDPQATKSAVFPFIFEYRCEEGFSLDGTEFAGSRTGTLKCLESGDFSLPQPCIPINDCIGHTCGPFGSCVDHHMNYTCDCMSGYAFNMVDGELICGNVDDCGPLQCGEGGECEDLVNDYTCNCRSGFELGVMEDGEKICARVECGTPPEVNHTEAVGSIKLVFEDVFEYSCLPGFSLDADRHGEKSFTINCLDTATFTDVKECKAVSCGQAPPVAKAEVTDRELFFGDAARYRCIEGYTIDGSVDGTPMFDAKCEPTGHFRERLSCQRISCGSPPLIQMSHVDAEPLLFGDEVTYTCSDGFSRDPENPAHRTFKGRCRSDGSIENRDRCFPVKCSIPEIPTGLLGEYFFFPQDKEMPNLPGHADLERIDTSFDIGSTDQPWPGVPNRDDYAVRWTGQLLIKQAGVYEFELESDDGSFLYLDGVLSSESKTPGPSLLGVSRRIGGVSGRHEQRQRPLLLLSQAVAKHRNSSSLLQQPPIEKGVKVVSNDGVHGMRKKQGSRELAMGPHEVYMEFFERRGGAGFKWRYKGPDTNNKWAIVPDHVVEPPSVTYAGPPTIVGQGADVSVSSAHFPQVVQYTCKKGYTNDGNPLSRGEITAHCTDQGQLVGVAPCVPVECARSNIPAVEHASMEEKANRISYGELLKFKCEKGYAVEMTLTDKLLLIDNGDLDFGFSIECLSNGGFSSPRVCKNIDDCEGHSCGGHGTCIDGIEDYECNCEEGYEQQVANGEKICGNVDDCGPDACGEHGLCFDLISTYRCECFAGYEPIKEGKETVCKPKICPELGKVEHTAMEMPVTLKFPESINIECAEGHSIDGSTNAEAFSFQVECGHNGELSAVVGCKPVECGFAPAVMQVSTSPPALKKFVFGEVARYACAEGHTLDGTASGGTDIEAHCGADGLFPPVADCEAVSCGIPARLRKGMVTTASVVFPGKAVYTCDTGFALADEDPLNVGFETSCKADGEYTQPPTGLLRPLCTACVIPDGGDEVRITFETCDELGAATREGAEVSVEVDGAWTETKPLPKTMDRQQVVNYDLVVSKWPTKLRMKAGGEWCVRRIRIEHCERALDILKPDASEEKRWFRDESAREFNGDHTYEIPPPLESASLDFAAATVAHDNLGGLGPDTGDAELRYAKVAKAQGRDVDLVLRAPQLGVGALKAEPRVEGKFAQLVLQAGSAIEVHFEFQDSSSKEPVEVPQFELSFFDLDRGLRSTKVVEARGFSVFMNSKDSEMIMKPGEEGWTSFEATNRGDPCLATTDPEQLGEETCNGLTAKRLNRAVMMRFLDRSSFKVRFNARCDQGTCEGTRRFAFAGHSKALQEGSVFEKLQCVRVACGEPPAVEGASYGLPGKRKFGELVTYDCDRGFTVDGTPQGVSDFAIQCQADGTFTPLLSRHCLRITYTVQGKVSDATNMRKLAGATIKLKQGDYEIEGTSDSMGVFTLPAVPPGDVLVKVTKDGYIAAESNLAVSGSISAGQGADMNLSPVLPNDGWRAVLTWDSEPHDLDSWAFFPGTTCMMCWYRRHVSCSAYSSVVATLDVDDVRSFGPETTTFLNLDNCQQRNECKIVFKVKNYSQRPGWASSGAVVKVYNGDREVATYKVGTDGTTNGDGTGSNQFWSVFVLDGKEGRVEACSGTNCA